MAAKLAGGNIAVALLGNTIPTGAILVVLITIFGPISGAHFNPAVSLVFALRRELPWGFLGPYTAAQIAGGAFGAIIANLMFDLPALQLSTTIRSGAGQWLDPGGAGPVGSSVSRGHPVQARWRRPASCQPRRLHRRASAGRL
jgi:glycerol uptake facilitator-like aquaporin